MKSHAWTRHLFCFRRVALWALKSLNPEITRNNQKYLVISPFLWIDVVVGEGVVQFFVQIEATEREDSQAEWSALQV